MSEYPIPNLSNDLSGQVALVTGTTSGLGKRFAQVIAASGAAVAVIWWLTFVLANISKPSLNNV